MNFAKIVKQCRIDKPGHFKLADHDPAECFGLSTNIDDVQPILAEGIAKLADAQQRLFADGRWAVLIVFQGMDAAGKDSVVKHVMSGLNPQGCEVHAFKAPSSRGTRSRFPLADWNASCRRAVVSAFSIARTTKKSWWCACIRTCWPSQKLPPELIGKEYLGQSLQGHPRLRASPRAQRHAGAEIPSALVQGRAAQAFSGAARRTVQALEVLQERHCRARPLGRLHGRLSGHDPRDLDRLCAVVCRARPTTSTSPGWSYRPRSSRRWRS